MSARQGLFGVCDRAFFSKGEGSVAISWCLVDEDDDYANAMVFATLCDRLRHVSRSLCPFDYSVDKLESINVFLSDIKTMLNIEYLTNKDGDAIAVVIPIDLWRQLLPSENASFEELQDAVEDYCLNKAMDEAVNTPLLDRAQALAYLEE
ncbi:hypothetical protein MiSe_01060 [Microseira wollei NIES-4236]|uniref:Uncharacterized protein n=2 Tax=Microseira wollei TaxID=467598 RepID=A0AAV3WE96_9CYAN|nr:hypothetical protein [Microseira wollei]GET35364.1 hypothetical protein MiSe_01060 [Microseira wollei NIES-4236]